LVRTTCTKMSCPAFIDLAESDQAAELRGYFKSLGADISAEPSEAGPLTDLSRIIEASPVCFAELNNEAEIMGLFNSIVSLVLVLPPEKGDSLVTLLSEKLSKSSSDRHDHIRLRLLSNLFHGLSQESTCRYHVYSNMVRMAGQIDELSQINTNLSQIKLWLAQWGVTPVKVQHLLRSLHDAFLACKNSENATKVMIELLGTYTEENASQAREDAHRCIVTCLADPSTYLMDHLLTLKPVKFLEGELIHNLLTIFVSGKLSQYIKFYQDNTDFVNSLGLSHEQNLEKIRLLTFMQMAENRKEIDFSAIEQELQLGSDEIESFIIDVLRTKAVRAKMDQMAKKVNVSTTTHRTFGKPQWQQVRQQLEQWQANLVHVQDSLTALKNFANQQP